MARGRTMARRGARPGRRAAGGGGAAAGGRAAGGSRILVMLAILALVPFSLPTMLVLFCGLLPTLAAAVAERGEGRYAWLCVGGLNVSGLAPWLFDLWFGHHTLGYAVDLLLTLNLYLSSYGAAAIGWLFYLAMPPVISTVLTASSQRRALSLASQQRKLVEEWGEEVTASAADDDDEL